MTKKKISFAFPHGKVEGIYVRSENADTPLVIITNGHNGFYNYGMFPYIQEQLAGKGISSYSYNFSHGGISGDSDYFTELDLYEKNCMRLETEDLCEIVRHLKDSPIEFSPKNKLFFLAHSMGAVPTIFASKKLLEEGYKIGGIILVSGVSTLNLWSGRITDEWEKTGVYCVKNNRTKQELPQGREFLEEIKRADRNWSVRNALTDILRHSRESGNLSSTKFLIVHGEQDEAVPLEHAKNFNEWIGPNSELKIIPGATHTYNTKHPFDGPSKELDQMIKAASDWIKNCKAEIISSTSKYKQYPYEEYEP